ncbi:permease [Chlorobium ferrooxidans]|uniref:Permease n=1 Tax=Chlorobium ferrooxidans DSM 13031 TaxID=377431 RepID=Q0YQ06_9CHLB|nr:permease [Chlorobium ferrooxidans]EAT58387.1 permease [Chlorobium ferrooxidans DSM 13031]
MESPEQQPRKAARRESLKWISAVLAAALLWMVLYSNLEWFAALSLQLAGMSRVNRFGEALYFFIYEVPKVLLLLTAVVFVMGVVHTFISAERTRALLSGKRTGVGNIMAAALGIVTPFCSCSAVPLFIGFLQAGVPLGVTFSFLISAPMINEVALALLFGMFGWKVALLYSAMGLAVAIIAGIVIGKLRMERFLEEWVQKLQENTVSPAMDEEVMSTPFRIREGVRHVREIVGKVWLYIVIGVGLGAGIHGYVPENFMAALMGKSVWWSVPVAVLIGVPMYSNAAGILPVVQALLGKGAALGTVMAFMMSVIALSAPEMIILRKVLKPRLIAVFAGIVAAGIMGVGYVFNLVL